MVVLRLRAKKSSNILSSIKLCYFLFVFLIKVKKFSITGSCVNFHFPFLFFLIKEGSRRSQPQLPRLEDLFGAADEQHPFSPQGLYKFGV